MDFKYFQYKLGTAKLIGGEMHASLHEINLESHDNLKPFMKQIFDCLTKENFPSIIKKHIERGINIGDENHTRFINAPSLPIKSYEPNYFSSEKIDMGLSGGDFAIFPPNHFLETYYYFWETKHPFSQWYKCLFKVEGQTFNSAEQYMMYSKALLFGDDLISEKILQINNAREQKKLGRTVKDFDKSVWDSKALEIVFKGNKAKFLQNPEILNLLLSTKGKTIVEASPFDSIWGIGLKEQEEASESIISWEGTNWLGIILSELREEIFENKIANG